MPFMQRKKPDVDVIKDVLEAALEAMPHSEFLHSLSRQYEERGGLSKRQLDGLLKKASKVKEIPPARLATLEAVILKKPTKYRSAPPPPKPLFTKDETVGGQINAILQQYPEHKRVKVFQLKYERNEPLSAVEITELNKFFKLLVK